ncbi:TolC family protein [Flammeovirga sp. MY04]|uniref:TolC family protein n=1 Tax=Flammeovirga sp. MY04 TaxID=1191459 RepID=UPI000806409F|nr:TolC family protein [Flammeovirga sp. MY04]ANQ48829.1 TolC family protein [Flammeovirga sp. MY04]
MKYLILIISLVWASTYVKAQKTLTLTQCIDLAQYQSNHMRIAKQSLIIERREYEAFKTELKPQLVLSGSPMAYGKNYNPITQPDGSIIYQPIEQNNTSMELNLEQRISATGGTIFMGSQMSRFDNIQNSSHQYQAQPFYVGYSQPIFQFNQLKWQKKLAPLQLQEAEKGFVEDMEFIALRTTEFYFNALTAQWNMDIAAQNVKDNKRIKELTKAKKDLGKASDSEMLQVELNVISAEQAMTSAHLDYNIALRALLNYLQLDYATETISLIVPSEYKLNDVNQDVAWDKAQLNRKDFISYQRRLLEGESLIVKAKRDNRFQANVEMAFGTSNQATDLGESYKNSVESHQVNVTLRVPILDWGRAKSRINAATSNYELVQAQIDQEKLDLQREVINASEQVETMAKQVKYIQKADEVAQQKYNIALQRYELGDISIRELVWSTDEKDQAKNAYLNTLKGYWMSYYQLRTVTLYDFEKNENIWYVFQ